MRRVGIIGAGVIAAVHAEALARVPGVRLTAVVEPNGKTMRVSEIPLGVGRK